MNAFTPFHFLPFTWLLAAAGVFLLAGLVKGVVGLGLPTVAMALLALWLAPADAAALLVLPSLVTNLWQLRPWSALPALCKRLATMQLAVFAGTLAGALQFGAPAGSWALLGLGVALVAYAAWGLGGTEVAVPRRTEPWLGPVVGAATGLVTAATGVFAVPAVPYLQALGLQRDTLVQAMGLSFSVSTVALALGLWLNGRYGGGAVATSLLMLLPALLGMALGGWLRQRLSPALFKRVFMVGLLLLGLHLCASQLGPWA